jgi:hypothetical protein
MIGQETELVIIFKVGSMKGLKVILFIVLLFTGFQGFAQVIDSTEIKLTQYKEWLEKGLITEDEYQTLKKKTLNISTAQVPKDTTTAETLKKNYKGKFIGGSVFMVSGISFMAGGIYYRRNPPPITPGTTADQYARSLKARNRAGLGIAVMGALQTGLGVFLIAKGGAAKTIYWDKRKKLDAGLTKDLNLGLTLTF